MAFGLIPATGAAFARIRELEDGKPQGRRSRDQSHAQRLAASMARTYPLRLFGWRLSLVKESGGAGINPPANGEQEHISALKYRPKGEISKLPGAAVRGMVQQMGRRAWTETDHFFHAQRLRMSPIIRLKMLATWASFAAHYTHLGTPEQMAVIFEVQLSHDRRVIGWVDDCPGVPPLGISNEKY